MKVGSYEYPDYRLFPTAVEATKIIFDKFKGESAPDNATVAALWGHKSVSGSVLSKLGALRSYGLLEKRGIKVTDLGKSITYPTNDDEKNEAVKQAILNIPLWAELYRKFGVNLPKENFWVDLRQITGLEAPDSQKNAELVRNDYMEDVKYLNIVNKPSPPVDPKPVQTRIEGADDRKKDDMDTTQVITPRSGSIPFAQFQFGESKVTVADKMGLEVIIGFLTNLKEVLDKQSNPSGKSEGNPPQRIADEQS